MAEPEHRSPEWWLERLDNQLARQQPTLERRDRYYEGDHRLQFTGKKFRKHFGSLFDRFADNWCELVVDAVEERLDVEGFRFGDDPDADRDAWNIWQTNQLDADSQLAHEAALVHGTSAAIVWANRNGFPDITVESAREVIVAHEPGNRRQRAAALKVWRDDTGYDFATLYLPDLILKFRTRKKQSDEPGHLDVSMRRANAWMPREVTGEQWPLRNPLGVVPVVDLVNRPRLGSMLGRSELDNVIPTQDAVNKLVADMLVASEFAAFRQRWATGIDVPTDPETGEAVEPFKAAIDRVFINENPEGRFGEFSATDLTNYVKAVELLVQHIASQTRTPPHYFYLGGQFPSGESIKSAEAGLVAKARRKFRHFGEAWEEVLRLAFAVQDDPRAKEATAETVWADPEYRTESEHVDALSKLSMIGVPAQQLWEDAGYSPTQIARFQAMRSDDALLAAVRAEVEGGEAA